MHVPRINIEGHDVAHLVAELERVGRAFLCPACLRLLESCPDPACEAHHFEFYGEPVECPDYDIRWADAVEIDPEDALRQIREASSG